MWGKLIVTVGVLMLFSCAQGEGESCNVTSDCEDGLRCCIDPKDQTANAIAGLGTCTVSCEQVTADGGARDVGATGATGADASGSDADNSGVRAADGSQSGDAPPADGSSSPDATSAETDTGPADATTMDAAADK